MSKIESILSVIFHAIYGTVCCQLAHLSYENCENTCTLSYYHHQIASLTNLLLFTEGEVMKQWYALYVYILIDERELFTKFAIINWQHNEIPLSS